MNTTLMPQEVSRQLRDFSPKKRFPPRELYSEIRQRFFEKYGYWPGALCGFDENEFDEEKILKSPSRQSPSLDEFLDIAN